MIPPAGDPKRCECAPPRWRSFTLVELLVTIAVISFLCALLSPALASAKEKANRVKCMSNMRQLALAHITYAHDHDGKFYYVANPMDGLRAFPMYYQGQGFNAAIHPWEELSNYVKNTGILYCPSALAKKISVPDGYGGGGYAPEFHPGTVQPWGSLFWSDTHYGYMERITSDVPPNFVLLFESPYLYGHGVFYHVHGTGVSVVSLDMSGRCITYSPSGAMVYGGVSWSLPPAPTAHGNGSNVGYVDGHIEWQSGDRLKWFYFYDDYSIDAQSSGWSCRGTF